MKSTKQELASIGAFARTVATLAATPTAKTAESPSDPQIVGIVLAADRINIDYGKIAVSKSKDKAVRDFAQRMVTDHSAVQKSVIGLVEKLGVNGEDSATSEGPKKRVTKITGNPTSLNGKECDKFYIDNEVSYHKTVTDAAEAVLIPSARNPELKSTLEVARHCFSHAWSMRAGAIRRKHDGPLSVTRRALFSAYAPALRLKRSESIKKCSTREEVLKWLATL